MKKRMTDLQKAKKILKNFGMSPKRISEWLNKTDIPAFTPKSPKQVIREGGLEEIRNMIGQLEYGVFL